FKVLSLNIHKGFGLGPKRLVPSKIREHLRASGATIVFLQEVVGANQRHQEQFEAWPADSQLEYPADTVWTHHAYGRNAIHQHGHHGNAILSALPFVRWNNIDASVVSFSQRGFLHGTIDGCIHLLCVHLGLFERERQLQVNHLIKHIRTTIPDDEPLILAGDFNDWRRTAHLRLRKELGLTEVHEVCRDRCARTYPAFMPLLTMDRIYLRGAQVVSCESLAGDNWRDFSDHLALTAHIRLL